MPKIQYLISDKKYLRESIVNYPVSNKVTLSNIKYQLWHFKASQME